MYVYKHPHMHAYTYFYTCICDVILLFLLMLGHFGQVYGGILRNEGTGLAPVKVAVKTIQGEL